VIRVLRIRRISPAPTAWRAAIPCIAMRQRKRWRRIGPRTALLAHDSAQQPQWTNRRP